jgi:pimeloyl-ACP methyl ester carboxylesterase
MNVLKARIILAALLLFVSTYVGAQPALPDEAASVPETPGEVLRSEPMAGAPAGASAMRIVYRSTDLNGNSIPVSGMLIVPAGPTPSGRRQIVAWAHGTTGVATSCAPSRSAQPFTHVMGLTDLLNAGYVVVATDYPGLGEAGPPSYLVGVSEAHAVLDSVRAARNIVPGTSARFAVWGHSQGGHSALFVRQIAASYAPELQLVGVAAAAPPTLLSKLLTDDIGEPVGRLVAAFTLWSWSRAYQADLGPIVFPQALPQVDALAQTCSETAGEAVHLLVGTFSLRRSFLQPNFATTEPWQDLLSANTPSAAANDVPLFIAQGSRDRIVRPSVTAAFVGKLCANGTAVHYVVLPGKGHNPSGKASAPMAVQWIQDRFAGLPPVNDCPAQ